MDRTPAITICIIARARIPELDLLVADLATLEGPAEREIVIAVETNGIVEPEEVVGEDGVRWLAIPAKRGIPYNRNQVADAARGEILLWTDDDCVPSRDWILALTGALANPEISAAAGGATVAPGGFVGDSISALGFPAGGNAGFKKMFSVSPEGYTDNLTTCSCAMRASTLTQLGGFNESLTQGGEDTELAYRIVRSDRKILYVPEATIVHPARTSLVEFMKWFYRRGRAKRQFSRLVPISGYVIRRFVSYGRILRAHLTDPKIILIVPLLLASILFQQIGFVTELIRPSHR